MKTPTLVSNHVKIMTLLKQQKFIPSWYDCIAFLIIMSLLAFITMGSHGMNQSLAKLQNAPIELSLSKLPEYGLYTTLRMFAALFVSLIFSISIASLAAKNRKAEMIIIPALDILQSVPILGFLSFTVTVFMGLFPGKQIGVELAAIFVIFSSQAWNMTFSFYQSLRNLPSELIEVSKQFNFNAWQKFFQLELPFAMPALVWNTMVSMSSGWFFIVASEAITVGNTKIMLPGIGSWLGTAIDEQNIAAIGWAIVAMSIIIIAYNQLIFRPITVWVNKFKIEATPQELQPTSWVYNIIKKSNIIVLIKYFFSLKTIGFGLHWPRTNQQNHLADSKTSARVQKIWDRIWLILLFLILSYCILFLIRYLYQSIPLSTVLYTLFLGSITALRVFMLIIIASLIWVPLGIWVGLRPTLTSWLQPLAQFLSAFPANILFPIFVIIIVKFQLNPDIWLSLLMILGAQWYIFFNVIAGTHIFPLHLKESCIIYRIRSWLWWRKIILPAILPYYITGALTASGGAWNASIVAEIVHWGPIKLEAHGLGAFIAEATQRGAYHEVMLGIAVMAIFVILFNRFIWQKLYNYAAKHNGFN